MKEYLIVGGGIDALMTSWCIKMQQPDADITLKTKNFDPRVVHGQQKNSSTWAGLSYRHVTYLESYNRNYLKKNDIALRNTVSNGGWLGKDIHSFSDEELKWLARRLSAQHFTEFQKQLFSFFQEYNIEAIIKWHKLINDHPELFDNVNIQYNMSPSSQEFSLQVTTFCTNLLNSLEAAGVKTYFDVGVSLPQDYQSTVVMVGAYGHDLLQRTPVKNRLFAVAGSWLTAISKTQHKSFHICTDDLWEQNYTYLGDEQYIVSGGYALAGFNYQDLSPIQKEALIKRNIQQAAEYCDDISPSHEVCFRGFTDNDLPLLSVETLEDGRKTVMAGGMNTGTTSAAPLTGEIIANLLLTKEDPWKNKLDILSEQWEQEVIHNPIFYHHYYQGLMKQCAMAN